MLGLILLRERLLSNCLISGFESQLEEQTALVAQSTFRSHRKQPFGWEFSKVRILSCFEVVSSYFVKYFRNWNYLNPGIAKISFTPCLQMQCFISIPKVRNEIVHFCFFPREWKYKMRTRMEYGIRGLFPVPENRFTMQLIKDLTFQK